MPVRYLSDAERAALSGWPEQISDEDLLAFFTLSGPDVRWVRAEGRHRGAGNLLGLSVQLCGLPWLGWIPDELTGCPPAALARIATTLGLDPTAAEELLAGYGGWEERTRRDHRAQVLARMGWRTAGIGERKALDEFLRDRALESDRPSVLLGLACDWLRAERIVRPTVDTLSRRVGAARDAAEAETYQRLVPQLHPVVVERLDALLEVDSALGMSRLVWLRRGATAATPEVIAAECDKLAFLRALGADQIDLDVLPVARQRRLAEIGKRSSGQALRRAAPARRYPVLLATAVHTYIEVLDELAVLFDQALAGADSRARHQLQELLLARARDEVDRVALLDELLEVLADPAIPDTEIGARIRSKVGMDRLRAAVRDPTQRPPRDHGHLDALDARYAYLREFTPGVLAALPLAGGTGTGELLNAVGVLRELNTTGRRRVPETAPEAFIPTRWRGYLDTSRDHGRGGRHRHYWELGVLYALQAALRSGDVWVPGSRRHPDPAGLLVDPTRWATQLDDFCTVTGSQPDPHRQLETKRLELHAALDRLDHVLTEVGDGLVRLDAHGELVVSPLPAEQLPPEVGQLADAAASRLPRIDLPSLLIEVDAWTGFTDALVHAGGAVHRDPELRCNLYAALISQSCNLGVAGMAEASGISEDTLAWTTRWYLREDTLRAANAVLVGAHHAHPLAAAWGGGTMSSSDGQRFPQRGKSLTARALSRYFLDEGTTTYTHVSDHHATFGTKVIPSTWREAVVVLDEIFGNPVELPLAEHTTDTAGQTLATFGIFDLAGLQFSPHIRDIGRLQLYRLGPGRDYTTRWPLAGPLLSAPIRAELIVEQWAQLLRLVGSMKFGHTTASLLIAKLHAGGRHNALARALHEYGKLVRTLYICQFLTSLPLRRRVRRQLNKGESLHALRRDLLFAHQGHIRRRHLDDQLDQALCLTVVTNAVIVWATAYLSDALDALRAEGFPVTDEAIAHLTPARHEFLNPYGTYAFDLDAQAQRGGRRPLRPAP